MKARFFYSHDVHVNPTYGNRQISLRILDHLKRRFAGAVAFADYRDADYDPSQVADDDLIIAHPGPALRRISRNKPHRRTLVVVPLPPPQELDRLVREYKHILLIGGRHWWESHCEARSDISPSSTRLGWHNMCLDLALFDRVKQRYNPPGKRQFLYLGRFDQARKNILTLIEAFASLHDRLSIVSPTLDASATTEEVAARDALREERYPNIKLVPFTLNTAPEFRDLVRMCDFYIHLATFDSQATAILECSAYGLVPVLTRESGFEFSFGGFVDPHDITGIRARIATCQATPGAELEGISFFLRQELAMHHTWQGLCARLDEAIDRVLAD